MTKNNKEKTSSDEIIVLDIIEQHAKDSINQIAKKAKISPQKVAKIIKHLEKNKEIWGYSAVTCAEKKHLKLFILLVKRSNLPLDDVMKKEVILEKLDDHNSNSIKIDDIFLMHGQYNAMISFFAPNLITAKKMVEELFGRIGQYLTEPVLHEVLFPIRKNGFKNPQIKDLVDYI